MWSSAVNGSAKRFSAAKQETASNEASRNGSRVVRERAGPHDRPGAVACRQRTVGLGLRPQVHAEDVVALGRVLGSHRAHHHVALDAGRVCRFEQLDRAVAVHRQLALRTAAGSRAGGEHDRVRVRDRSHDLVCGGRFEVAQNWLAAIGPQLGGMVGVTDQATHPVTARNKALRQPSRDLSVPACDHDIHRGEH
jgi:hypothetical protein